MKPIDPLVIKERRRKLGERARLAQNAMKASDALAWFGEYAIDRTKGVVPAPVNPNTIDSQNRLATAQAMEGHQHAQMYVAKAAVLFREQIVAKAIELAQADLAASDEEG